SGSTSSRTKASAQSSFAWYSGSVSKSHAMSMLLLSRSSVRNAGEVDGVAQHVLLDLAGGVAWQLVDDGNELGRLHGRDAVLDEERGGPLARHRRGVRPRNDHQADALAVARVGHADRGGIGDGRVPNGNPLDLHRRQVLGPAD